MKKEQRPYNLNQLVLENDIYNPSFAEQLDLFIMKFLHKNYPTFCTAKHKCVFEALYSAGKVGMWEAKVRYNPEKGTYCTYARLYLRGAVRQAYNKEVLHLSDHYANVYRKLQKVKNAYNREGKSLTVERWAELAKVSVKTTRKLMKMRYDLVYL